jgi:uncharacterized protein (TIGR03067 family)
MRLLLSAVFVLATTGIALADDKAPAGDLAKLQGKWKGTIGQGELEVTVEIKDTTVTASYVSGQGENVSLKGKLKVDDKAQPKTVDWVEFKRDNGDEMPDNLAIYELSGDEWKICNGGPGNPRPTEFKNGDDGQPSLITLKRVKEEKKSDSK